MVTSTYVVDLHLAQRARPAIEAKDLIRERYCLVAFQVCNLAAAIAWSRRYVFRAQLLVQSALQCRDLRCREVVHDAFFEWVRHVAATVLVAWPTISLVKLQTCLQMIARIAQ